jgi:hypothetical protein
MSSISDRILGPDSSFPSDLEMPELPEMFSSSSSNNDASSTAEISDYNVSDSGDGIMGYFASLTGTTWFLIILLLGFLGFNVFVYLAKGTNLITSTLEPIVKRISTIFVGLTSQVTDVSAEGAKEVIDTSASTTTAGLTAVQNITPGGPTSEPSGSSAESKTKTTGQDVQTTFPKGDVAQANALNKAINSSTAQRQQQNGEDYQADDSSSSIQKGTSKAGFCYIGEDRGFRTCEEVGVNDTCMSGNIFPTRDVCVNPTLRA